MKIKYLLLLIPLLGLMACNDEHGRGIGRAQRAVALDSAAECSHYLQAVKPNLEQSGYVTLAPKENAAATAENYTLCQFGLCEPLNMGDGEVTITLPLGALSLKESGELALVAGADFQNPAKICSYLRWEPTPSDGNSDGNSDGTTDGDTDGNSDGSTDGETDGNSDGTTDGETDGNSDGSTDGETDGNSDGTTDGETDGNSDGSTDGETAPNSNDALGGSAVAAGESSKSSLGAAVVSAHWPADAIFIFTDKSCIMRAKRADPRSADDWECQ